MMRRTLIVWVAIMTLAILNGGIRERLLVPEFGPAGAHVMSTLLLGAVILAAAYTTLPWLAPASLGDAMKIGLVWLALTLSFEFLAGHYIFGSSWQTLLADYDVRSGRIWPLIPLMTLTAPAIAFIRVRTGTTP